MADTQADTLLIQRARAGDADAYCTLAERWAMHVHAICRAHLGRTDLADQAAEDAFVRAFEELSTLPHPERFGPWLLVLVSAVCRAIANAPKSRPSAMGLARVPQTMPRDAASVLRGELESLPVELRTVFLLHAAVRGSYRDLSDLLDQTTPSLARHLAWARRSLVRRERAFLSEFADAPPEPPGCLKAQEWLSARADGELPPEDGELLGDHLAACAECTAYADTLAAQDRLIRAAVPERLPQVQAVLQRLRERLGSRVPYRCSLLIVDDEPYILSSLRSILSREYDVITAANPEEAETILRATDIDLVLSDQKMPVRTGIQLLTWVRENSPQTIRLLMTGYTELEDAVEAINRGNVYYYLLKPWRNEDLLQILRNAADKFLLERKQERYLEELQRLNRDLENRVKDRTRALQEANLVLQQRARELERLALTDPLTGLLNRRAIDELATFELKRTARYPGSLAIGFVDADHFKEVNTKYLLTGGDEVLKGLARVLTTSLREVDSVGRIGGEEFLVIARETTYDGAVLIGERLRAAVEQTPILYGGESIRITVSIGLVVIEAHQGADYPEIRTLAAAALSEAKTGGRNRVVIKRFS